MYLSMEFDYEVFYDSDEDIHDEECYGYDDCSCDCSCDVVSKKFIITFKTCCGQDLQYIFDSTVTVFFNKKDKLNLKRFIYVLKNSERINNINEDYKQQINQVDDNRTDLTKNRRLYYDTERETLTFDFDYSRYNENSIKFDVKHNLIIFCSCNSQCCGSFCSCYDCLHYQPFRNSVDVSISFKTDTKMKIIEAFEYIYGNI